MAFFRNLLVFPFKLWEIKKDISQQKSFWNSNVSKIIEPYLHIPDDSLSLKEIEKLRDYYGIGSMVLAGVAISKLHNFKIPNEEKLAITFLSSTTGLYDDFFDKHDYSGKIIQDLSDIKSNVTPKNNAQKLFRELLAKAIQNLPNKEISTIYSQSVYKTQENSLSQKNSTYPSEQLLNLSLQKGGASMLLFRSCFSVEISKQEKHLLELTGGLLQICNDVFDIAKDISEGVRTIATECKSIASLKDVLNHQTDLVRSALKEGDFKNPKDFWDRIRFVTAQTHVALAQYQNLEKLTDYQFLPYSYTSEQLIVEMKSTTNFVRAVYYWIKQ